jgi:hypothetical protein
MQVTIGGNARGGWLVDVHDGVNSGVYSPRASNDETAREKAIGMHRKAFRLAENDPEIPGPASGV